MNRLYEAIGEINDDYIEDAETASAVKHHFRWKPILAACLAIVMLALPVSAEMVNGYVSNLLAPLYGGSQTELVDKIMCKLIGILSRNCIKQKQFHNVMLLHIVKSA